MKRVIVAISVVIVLVIAGIVAAIHRGTKNYNTAPITRLQTSVPSVTDSPKTNFTVNADDYTADVTSVTVKKGKTITATFNVRNNDEYHEGLDFRSDIVSTGTIPAGGTKVVTFVADRSFEFTPYWPASQIKKDYVISVKVQ